MTEEGTSEEVKREDESSDDEKLTVPNNRSFTRQELKQLDREIPWKELITLPRATYEKYLDSVYASSLTTG